MKNKKVALLYGLFILLALPVAESIFIEQEVSDRLATQEWVRVSITFEEGTSSAEIVALLGDNFILENKDEFVDQWIGGKINSAGLQLIQNDGRVKGIFITRTVHTLLAQSLQITNSNQRLLRQINRIGIQGKNHAVCVIDSGVDKAHQDLLDKVLVEQCYCSLPEGTNNACCYNGQNQQSGSNSALDNDGHGTHVAGIIAANGRVKGIAPEARLAVAKVCNSTGDCTTEDISNAIYWCIANKDIYNISAISISLGGGSYNNPAYCDSNLPGPAITSAYYNKTAVIIASGNDASTTGISLPACASKAVSVGAVYDANVSSVNWGVCADSSTQADKIVCFTNRYANLTLLAPGAIITSTNRSGGRQDSSGTSQATPHVSGTVALLKEANNLQHPLTTSFFSLSKNNL